MISEITMLRMNIMGGMNEYIKELGDEWVQDYWNTYGLPDECDEDELLEIAEDDKLWLDVIKCFNRCLEEGGR